MPNKVVWVAIVALLAGCDERERLTFPSDDPGADQVGPITVIDEPLQDTVLTSGDPFVLAARSIDPSGVDTVYVEVEGVGLSYPPIAGGGADTLHIGLQVPTIDRPGETYVIRLRAVDVLSNSGGSTSRRITIE
jgi:hypothetical protein